MRKILSLLLIILLSCSLASCKDQETDEVQEILEKMTLREKAAQMLMPSFSYASYRSNDINVPMTALTAEVSQIIEDLGFGGIILFSDNIHDAAQTVKLIEGFNTASVKGGHLPLLIGADQEGGAVSRISFGTIMPGNMALGANGDSEDIYQAARIIGNELRDLGINLDLAPDADINSDPSNPIIGIRSFSDDPVTVADDLVYFVKGLEDEGVISAIKHFPGHGDTDTDSHTGLPMIEKSLEEISSFELIPFKKGIDAGVDMVMSAHIQYPLIEEETYHSLNGEEIYLPATLSDKIIQGILREKLSFNGVVITDSLSMNAIAKNFRKKDAIRLSINAGVDMLLMPVDEHKSVSLYLKELRNYVTAIVNLVKEGAISEERIDEAVSRIITLKLKHGILHPDREEKQIDIGSKSHHETEMEITEKAITLIKNDGLLPLSEDDKVLIMAPYGPQTNSMRYGIEMLKEKGLISSSRNISICTFGNEYTQEDFNRNIRPQLKKADTVVFLSYLYETADLNGIEFKMIDRSLMFCQKNKKKTVLVSCHLPYDLARFEADAKIAAYYAAGIREMPLNEKGYPPNLVAALMVLYGDRRPGGRLPVNVPELLFKYGEYSYSSRILYERGYSITYE
jgi:beta-N-acetylhexosaminidase